MKKIGIIIGIEEYSNDVFPKLSPILFAANDVLSIKKIFNEQLFIEDENILFLVNEKATRSAILKETDILLKKFTSSDELYFYYVGHGFNSKNKNRMTCWDSDNSNLEETSLSFDEILLKPLRDSECQKSFIFIDSSAEEIKSMNKVKSSASSLVETEYSELSRVFPGNSFFLSCYPGEKSFNSVSTKHGLWALHLINAMNGKDDSALDKNNAITNVSLSKFLATKIPQHITKTMFINERQSPFGVVNESNVKTLIAFENDDAEDGKNAAVQFHQYIVSREQFIPYKNFKGFNKARHKIPKDRSSFASKLAIELAQEEFLKLEVEELFDKARKNLRLKNSNTAKDPEGGSLHTEFFRYNISADQSDIDFSEILIKRELELRVPLVDFPMPIDEIFTEGFDTITFPIKGSLDVDSLEDALYELEDDNHGTFEQKDNLFSFYPKNIKGIAKVEISKNSLKIRFSSSQTPVSEILDYTQQTLVVMSSTLKNLL